MRIIAGLFKGRTVEPVEGQGTRPTGDRVREAIASSVISNHGDGFSGAHMLDAFAGSGAMGIEGISRGATSVTFVDNDAAATSVIESNLARLPLDGISARVLRTDILAARLPQLPHAPFDIVFLDPPYATDHARVCQLLLDLASAGMLAPGALVVYEFGVARNAKGKKIKPSKGEIPREADEMRRALGAAFGFVSAKLYGNTQVVYFTYDGQQA